MTIALEIHQLDYCYRTDWLQRRVQAIRNVSLSVAAGESFGFLGHNGAGKTTTIKCILDLVRPSRGAISIFGLNHRAPSARAAIGFIPEQPYFYDYLTVLEIMEFYAALKGIARAERARAIDTALARVGMTERRRSVVRSLSKGLTQRVAMAQAILGAPRLLVLDEPFSGLDPIGRKEFRDLLFELKHAGATIFVSSHILNDIEFLCDRASIMVKGEVKGIYDLRALATQENTSFELALGMASVNAPAVFEELRHGAAAVEQIAHRVTMKFASRAIAERALRRALDAGVMVLSFEPVRAQLEQIFVSLVQSAGKESRHHG